MPEFRIGDVIEIVNEDAPDEICRATVIRFMSDEEQGMAPEVEDYVTCWVEVAPDGACGESAKQFLTMGTDSRYRMNGRPVLLRKA
jgi:hypothetical protein